MSEKSWITGDIFTSSNPTTTLAAWKPYRICVGVLFELQNTETEPRFHGWQVEWIAGMSMLRSVGYVLKKVDAHASIVHKEVVASFWTEWSKNRDLHSVFWDFIDMERHNILKEFALGFTHEPYLEPEEYEVETAVYVKMDQFREAVYWWRFQLRSMEEEISTNMK